MLGPEWLNQCGKRRGRHLGGSVGWVSAFGSGRGPGVLEWSPISGSLLGGESASPSAPHLMLSCVLSLSLSLKNK